MVKIAIVGVGDMGIGHIRGFDKFDNCEILAVCDTDEKMLEYSKNFIRKSNPKFLKNFEDVLSIKDIDAVVISVPNFLHRDFAIASLDRNLDVFLEKPVAHNITACDEIIEKWGNTDRILQIGLVYRYSNLYRTIAQLIEKGTFGNIMMMYCKEHRDNFPSSWFFDENKSGGAILDKNCHHFDIFNWYINSLPVKIFASGGQHVAKGENYKVRCSYARDRNLVVNNPTIVDHAFVVIEYENSAKASLSLCMYEIEPIEGLEIGGIGDNGSHFIAKNDVSLIVGGGSLGEIKEIPIDYFSDNEGIGHIGCQIERKEFLECVEKRCEPYANLYIGRQSIVVALAAEKSIKEGRVVYYKEFDNPRVQEIFRKKGYLEKKLTPLAAASAVEKKEKKESLLKFLPLFFKLLLKVFFIFIKFSPTFFKLLFAGKVKSEIGRELVKKLINDLSNTICSNKEYLKLSKGLNVIIRIIHSDKSLILKMKDGALSVLDNNVVPDVSITFTRESLVELFLGKDLQKLFLTRKIIVDGDISKLIPYTEVFIAIPKIVIGK